MATVTLTFSNATSTEARAAQLALDKINAERVAHGLTAFATVKDYLADIIINRILPVWLADETADRAAANKILELWGNASDTQRNNAKTALTT